jgi:dTDP-4-amino-4,6-dideoxygalactose transaminase
LPYFHPSHVWHQYVIRVPRRRDELRAWLQSQGVGTQVHYPLPPHRVLGFDFNLPDADLWASEVLSLPLGDETIVRATSQAIKEWGAS